MAKAKSILTVKRLLSKYHFPELKYVEGRSSVADLFKSTKRCGIYIFRFKNNQYYVGQAIDVTRRYVQHSKTHKDIKEICFKTYPRKSLNKIEEELIKVFEEKKIRLRNISLTSLPKGISDLDLIVSRKEQEKWCRKPIKNKLGKHLINEKNLKDRYTKKYKRLINHVEFHDYIFPFLKEYFHKCIISPEKTELSFWSLTCLPFENKKTIVLCRLNLYWCEVLGIIFDKHNQDFSFSFQITKSRVRKNYLHSLKVETLEINDYYLVKGGPDQFNIIVRDVEDAMKLLKDRKVLSAIKTFNLRLMQKGATVFGRYHCIDLAKHILTK